VLRRGLAPLETLAHQASAITSASLSTRFAATGLPGELTPITTRLNELLARLESSFERERQFSSDLAHELRTPIAELRSVAEVALKWPDARPAETDRETLAIASQLDGIVGRLLALLRSERGQLPVEWQDIYLEAEIERACHAVTARAEMRRVRIERPVGQLQIAHVDVVLLRSILANLLDNAVDYSPEGGTVGIECASTGDTFWLRVSNDAGDLRAEDVPRLFDRFWRGSASRSDHEHSGLGLSLARAFAEAIGCSLIATLETGRITLELASTKHGDTINP
jgi:two-component system sensor histidine kinase QseC